MAIFQITFENCYSLFFSFLCLFSIKKKHSQLQLTTIAAKRLHLCVSEIIYYNLNAQYNKKKRQIHFYILKQKDAVYEMYEKEAGDSRRSI
jgi:hypothetical protein